MTDGNSSELSHQSVLHTIPDKALKATYTPLVQPGEPFDKETADANPEIVELYDLIAKSRLQTLTEEEKARRDHLLDTIFVVGAIPR